MSATIFNIKLCKYCYLSRSHWLLSWWSTCTKAKLHSVFCYTQQIQLPCVLATIWTHQQTPSFSPHVILNLYVASLTDYNMSIIISQIKRRKRKYDWYTTCKAHNTLVLLQHLWLQFVFIFILICSTKIVHIPKLCWKTISTETK